MTGMEEASRKIKRSRASLTGGFVVGFAVTGLAWLVTPELGWPEDGLRLTACLVVGIVMGLWVRVADL